jgi:hypothetical protein
MLVAHLLVAVLVPEDEAEQKAVAPLLVMVVQVTHGLQEMV